MDAGGREKVGSSQSSIFQLGMQYQCLIYVPRSVTVNVGGVRSLWTTFSLFPLLFLSVQ